MTVRSALYVAAHRAEHLAKALSTEADALVVELEDGVPADAKRQARAAGAEFLATTATRRTEVRVNGFGTGLLLDDLRAVAPTGVAAVRVPKVQSVDDVRFVARLLEELGSDAGVVPILESAVGIAGAVEIARAHERVVGILMGEEDLKADLGYGDRGLVAARSAVVLAARAAGLPAPLQSVWTRLGDEAGLRADCEDGRELGFGGRSVIHPSQVAVVHEVYTPTDSEVAEARAVLALAGRGGTVLADGQFVDDASVARARRVLDAVAGR
ncbi:MAG: CoA ester lyase [Propionibacteriales bacterium]|nr:CoA ester lyase [Propionibacteriales bacterium]